MIIALLGTAYPANKNALLLENQRELFREVHSKAWHIRLERRADLRNSMHGEIHGSLEPGQLLVPTQDTAGSRKYRSIRALKRDSHFLYHPSISMVAEWSTTLVTSKGQGL